MNRKGMIYRQALFAAAGILLLGVGGCSGKKADEVEAIRNTGNLRVAIVDTSSQYTRMENGTPVGVEPELAEYIAQNLGVKTEYQVLDKRGALEAVTAGEADMALGSISNSSSMSGEFLTSTPYAKGFLYAVTRQGDFISTVGAFRESALGADRNLDEGTRTRLYSAEGVSISDYASPQDGVQALKDGSIRAYICYENQAKLMLEESGLQVQNIMNLEPEQFVIAVPQSSQNLLSGINILIRQYLEGE